MDFEKLVRKLDEELSQTREEAARLKSLLESLELINSTLDFNMVLDYLMEIAQKITDAEGASAMLLESDLLAFVAASGTKSTEIKRVYLSKTEGIAGWVIQNGCPIMVDDVRTDERFSNKADVTSGFVTKSIIAVPMKIEGEIIGVIEAVNKSGGGVFNHKDVEMLATLANSAAMAIQKSRLYADLNELFFSTVRAMADAIEAKDTYTRGHSERIRSFSLVIADEMGFSDAEKRNIEISALLHDIGKIGISEAVLCKQGKLTDAEFAEIKKHPTIGADMLSSIKQLRDTIPGIRHHQERYDGKGYPDGLAGSAIPMFARIIAVADTFDAMTSDRPYRAAMPDHDALAELERFSGIQFDPDCVAAFANGYRKGLIISQWSEKQKKQGA